MFGPQVLDRTAALLAAKNMLDAELARTVREGELTQAAEHDGPKTMASWLRGHARLSPAAVGQLVRNGRALEKLPAVAAAFAGGGGPPPAGSGVAPGGQAGEPTPGAAPGGGPGGGGGAP